MRDATLLHSNSRVPAAAAARRNARARRTCTQDMPMSTRLPASMSVVVDTTRETHSAARSPAASERLAAGVGARSVRAQKEGVTAAGAAADGGGRGRRGWAGR